MRNRVSTFACLAAVAIIAELGAGCGSSDSPSPTGAGGGATTSTTTTTGSVVECGDLKQCSGVCVDTTNDPKNCGACGAACASDQLCSGAQCGVTCLGGTTQCGLTCLDTTLDAQNCGGCGKPCADGEVCVASQCVTAQCPPGSTACGADCFDTQHDPSHCGGCATVCTTGQVCSIGQCGLTCVGGSVKCGALCVDTVSDPLNCGACAKACDAGDVCSASQCVPSIACSGSTTQCTNACVDLETDANNCGACGTVCAAAAPTTAACVAGACRRSFAFTDPEFHMASDGTNLYVLGQTSLVKIPVGGGAPTTIADSLDHPDTDSLVIDDTHAYWANNNVVPATIQSVPLDGSAAPLTFASGSFSAEALALDATSIYYGSSDGIFKLPKAGGAPLSLAPVGGSNLNVYGIALDANNLYWTTFASPGALSSVNLSGLPTVTTLATGFDLPFAVATNGTSVFFTDDDMMGAQVYSIPVSGGSASPLNGGYAARFIPLVLDGDNLYYVTDTTTVWRQSITTGAAVLLDQDRFANIEGVAVDATSLYWADYSGGVVVQVTPK